MSFYTFMPTLLNMCLKQFELHSPLQIQTI